VPVPFWLMIPSNLNTRLTCPGCKGHLWASTTTKIWGGVGGFLGSFVGFRVAARLHGDWLVLACAVGGLVLGGTLFAWPTLTLSAASPKR